MGLKCFLCKETAESCTCDDISCYDVSQECDPAVKPNKCEECQVPTGHLFRTQVDGYGRTLWLCGKRHHNCRGGVQNF